MRPLRLQLENVGSFRHLDLPIPEGTVAIVGANGAGKSTLVNAIEHALYGPQTRTLADLLPDDGSADRLSLLLEFAHGGHEYRTRRTYIATGRGKTILDLEEGDGGLSDFDARRLPSSDWRPLTLESAATTQQAIDDLLGMSRETFRASSFLAQREGGLFCEAPPREQKRMLSDLFGLQIWDGHLERARQERRTAELVIAEAVGFLDRATAELADRDQVAQAAQEHRDDEQRARVALQETLVGLAAAREALAEARGRAERRTGATAALGAAQEAHTATVEALRRHETAIQGLDERMSRRDSLAAAAARLPDLEAEQEILRAANEAAQIRERLTADRQKLRDEAADLDTRALALERKAIVALEHPAEETCDRCQRLLDPEAAERAAASYRAEAHELHAEAVRRRDQADMLTAELATLPDTTPDPTRLTAIAGLLAEARRAGQELAALAEVETQQQQTRREAERLAAMLPDQAQRVSEAAEALEALGPDDPGLLQTARDDVDRLEHDERRQRQDADQAATQAARYAERLARLDTLGDDVAHKRAEQARLQDDAETLALLERACGPNGVPAMILENVAVPELEAEWSRLLGLLGGPAFAVELRTLREKKTGGLADTLEVMLLVEGGVRPFGRFSGGERARISVAQRLAFREVAANRSGAQMDLLVLDELDGLDSDGVAALVRVVEGMRVAGPKFLISHNAELRDAIGQSLLLENDGAGSRVVSGVVPMMEPA